MTFLKRSAHQIWLQFSQKVSDHLFLFPSRRSMLYFKKEMVEAAGQNLWMPDCLTLEEWVMQQTEEVAADNITLTYHLYQAAVETGFTDYGFEEFYPLAQIILKDFEEVNMELVDPEELWLNTVALQDLTPESPSFSVWEEMGTGALQQRWRINWDRLLPLFRLYTSDLQKEGLSGKGRIYRKVSEHLSGRELTSYPRVHVIGFSILSKSEIRILDHLRHNLPVSFYWNLPSRMGMPGLDAGMHTKEMMDYFGQDLEGAEHEVLPQVEMISTSGMMSQIKLLNQALEDSGSPEEKMAVVLPNPSLIDLFLRSFPDLLDQVNISLGYPLVYSPVRSLTEWIIDVWEDVIHMQGEVRRDRLMRLWSHMYMAHYLNRGKIAVPGKQQLYFRRDHWTEDDLILKTLFGADQDDFDPLTRMIDIVDMLIPVQPDAFHREILRYARGRLVRVRDVVESMEELSFVFLKRLLFEIFLTSSAPFRGEPMEGVQVLGVQEVQNLGFDTLLIPGMNEEILPSGRMVSLIPYSLRKHFGLKDQADQMRAQSYYLWSALLNAKDVKIFYSNSDDLLGAKGMSRYVYQLKYGDLEIPLKEKFLDLDLDGFESQKKMIFPDQKHLPEIEKFLRERGLSPSALITYLRCPFQFYLTYVLDIREESPPEAGLDARDMGSVIHEVMHQLYLPYRGKEVKGEDYEKMKEKVAEFTSSEYQKLYPSDSEDTLSAGVHWMEQEIIIRAVHRFLDYDRRREGVIIDRLEEKVSRTISTEHFPEVRLTGVIDRVDRLKEGFRIVDYKTGESKLLKRGLDYILEQRSPSQNLQLLFYAYLLKDHIGDHRFELGHYTLREADVYNAMMTRNSEYHDSSDIEKFEEGLKKMIDEMADPEVAFPQTDKLDFCRTCVFVTFCERQYVL